MIPGILSSPFSPIVNLFKIVTFFLLAKGILCTDSQYLACNPRSCGDGQNISFPFYIKDQQESFCGYPGFELSCNTNGQPVLQLPGNKDYIIRQIFYNNQSFRVSNAAFLHNNSTAASHCIPPIQNMSFPEDRFKLSPNATERLLIYNCNSSILANETELLKHRIYCLGRSETDSEIAMLGDDPLVGYASNKCSNLVELPVAADSYRKESNVSIERMVENGFLLQWIASDCSECSQSGGKCGFDKSKYLFKCYCSDRPHSARCKSGNGQRRLELGLGLGIGVLILMAIFLLSLNVMWHCYRRTHDSSKYLSSSNCNDPSSKADLEGDRTYFGIPVFSYSELAEATNNFASETELGDGGFGTVYYGKLRDGREVAVKHLYEHNYRRVEQFRNEIAILTRLHHKNLVSLYGCTSSHGCELLLVYEYISNGTVADHLHGDQAMSSQLTWPIRMSIAIETANALVYLHASDIIHRDVKTNNILLDSHFCVKVADFGLSRLFPNDATHVSTIPQGSPGYVDPEYQKFYQLTDKSDVYSFGVVLIELISSMPAVDISRHRDEINLSYLAISKIQMRAFDELIDPSLGYKSDDRVKRMTISVAELAFRCLQQDKEMRPSMEKVLEELKRIESKDYGENRMEVHDDSKALKTLLPAPSPPSCDQPSLLKNLQPPPSPNSLTDTQNTSSCSTAASVSS